MNPDLQNHSRLKHLGIIFASLLIASCATAPPAEKISTYWDGYFTVALSPSGKYAAAANRYVIVLFDIEQQRQAGWFWAVDSKGESFRLPRSGIGDTLEFIDEHHIATTGMGALATVWDIRNGQKVTQIDAPSRGVHALSLAYSRSTGELALGTRDGTILITRLDGEQSTELEYLHSHVGRVNDLAFSLDGKYMASAGHDRLVIIWDMETRQEMGRLEIQGDVSDLELFAARRSLIVAGDDVAIWAFLSEEEALALSEDKAIGQWLGTGALYALQAGLLFTGLGGGSFSHDPQNCGRFVSVSPDGEFLVDVKPGPLSNKVTVLDIGANEILHEVDVKNAICDVEFSPDGSRLVLAGDGGLFLVDVASWTQLPVRMIVDGFSHAPRVILAEPGDQMGLAITAPDLVDDLPAPAEPDEATEPVAPESATLQNAGQPR